MTTHSFDVLVQHHPKRVELLAPLLASVPRAQVVADPDPTGYPSPWRTYRECLLQPIQTTHRVVLQDDVEVCRNFEAVIEKVIAARPLNPVALFVGGQPRTAIEAMGHACAHEETFAEYPSDTWLAAVAVLWPTDVIEKIVAWVDKQRWPVEFRADDEILGRAARAYQIPLLATVPSLVEHPDVVESVTGRNRHMRGVNTDRVAWCFADKVGIDPLELDWR